MSATMPYSKGWRAVRRKASGKWEARWADDTGTARGKTFYDKAQAQKFADDMANRLGNALVGLPVTHVPIAEAVQAFLERRLNPKTTALNERRIKEFLTAMPSVRYVEDLTDRTINQFDAKLEAAGHNPGGRNHVLKIIRALCQFCLKRRWLGTTPFADFKMPKSSFEGRPLTEDEFNLMCSIGWVGSNKAAENFGIGWTGGNQYKDVDLWLRRAFILGRETMLRISQVWKLTAADFREPDQLRVEGIKGQESVTISLTPLALTVVRDLLQNGVPGERLFSYWESIESMRTAVYKKGLRVGLRKKTGADWPRFHDVCKVTRVSQLDGAGFSVKEIEQVSNTTARTLLAHYIKPDRVKTFDKYKAFAAGVPQTDNGRLHIRPTTDLQGTNLGGNHGTIQEPTGTEGTTGKV